MKHFYLAVIALCMFFAVQASVAQERNSDSVSFLENRREPAQNYGHHPRLHGILASVGR